MINEYILAIHGKGEVFRVYNYNEKLALQTFINACDRFSDTKNEEEQRIIDKLLEMILCLRKHDNLKECKINNGHFSSL